MEDIPAGRSTKNVDFEIPSPKKVYNPIGNDSQWSFGWQGNEKSSFNRANNSKGTSISTKVSIRTTTQAALSSARGRESGRKKSSSRWM